MVSLTRRAWRDERGGVAAEFAVTLPAVLLVLTLALGAVSAQGQRVLLQDAVADAARLLARGEDSGRASAAVTAAVPAAQVSSGAEGDLVCVAATAPMVLFGEATITISARACALSGGL
ncbi:TadE family type IV pilus minor pilin [Microbacterium gorillae]|uniref:TadE family type IV pilus minor pilin n=1 Tax=Microbacterium gorillae TaxID=1231063 RepID=UPI003D98F677